jgi:hypothetical protein
LRQNCAIIAPELRAAHVGSEKSTWYMCQSATSGSVTCFSGV